MNKTIRSQAREVIHKVFLTCLAEFQAGKLLFGLEDVYKRTAKMTGKSESTVRRIAIEKNKSSGKLKTPAKHRQGRPQKQINDFDICAIRQKIHFFYTIKKEVPTLQSLRMVLKDDMGYDGSKEHLRKLLRSIGFNYKKCQSKRAALIEQAQIADKREIYLDIIKKNRDLPENLKKPIIYLDESYIHSSYKIKKCWQSIQTKGVLEEATKGKRWIMVLAGNENGFVPNALLMFSGQNKKEGYHSEMNQQNFKKWIIEKLVPNLTEPSIIVMDNAPYHSVIRNKAPTSNTRIADMRSWLQENGIPFDPSLRKPSLYMWIKKNKPAPIYEIDEILGEFGHTVVRLPPYHCDLNPIELIWALAKRKVASKNVGACDIKQLTEEAFSEINENDWKLCCDRVTKIEKTYYESGKTLYQNIESLKLQTGSDSESSESDEEYEEPTTEATEDEFLHEVGEEHLDFNMLE